MKYYLAGYYLTVLRPLNRNKTSSLIYTCSECINDNLLDRWAYTWTTDNDASEIKTIYNLNDQDVDSIRDWVEEKTKEGKMGWVNAFMDLETTLEFKNRFFSHINDIKIMAIYFDEKERADILEEFKPKKETFGEIGLRETLFKGITENENEDLLGYDYIGIELDGSFHSFQCHDLGKELGEKFGLSLNNNGLFENRHNAQLVLNYLNDEKNGCEPVPWYLAIVKIIHK